MTLIIDLKCGRLKCNKWFHLTKAMPENRMAEWSKAPVTRTSLYGGDGSTPDNTQVFLLFIHSWISHNHMLLMIIKRSVIVLHIIARKKHFLLKKYLFCISSQCFVQINTILF